MNAVQRISYIPPRELPRARRRWKASRCMPLMALLLLVVSALVMLPIAIYFLKDLL